MIYTIDKNYLVEEAFRLDTPQKIQKFTRRSVKATNNISPQKFQQDALVGTVVAPVVGGIVGGILPSVISDESDGLDTTMGAVGGTILGSSLGINAVTNRYSPHEASNTRASKAIITRLQRDGYQPTSEDKSIIDKANAVTRQVNMAKYMSDIASKGR